MFSDDLKNKLIAYFKKEYAVDITPEQAGEYLNSLADLFTITGSILNEQKVEDNLNIQNHGRRIHTNSK
jgi:hypothetical protein